MQVIQFQIEKDDGITEMICDHCKGKLQEAFTFNQLIIQSDYILQENNHLKKIFYDHYEDLKVKIKYDYLKIQYHG